MYPGKIFDLSTWELDLPVKSGSSVEIISNSQLESGYTSKYFFLSPDNSMTFMCPITGAHTPNSTFPRSELREVLPSGDWSLSGSHTLTVKCKVTQLAGGKGIIIGQIHGDDASTNPQLVKLFWTTDNEITVQIKSDTNPSGSEITYKLGTYKLGETISYQLEMVNGALTVIVTDAANNTATHTATFKNSYWTKQKYYFKAGVYLQNHSTSGSQYGEAQFYVLSAVHKS